MAVPESPNNFDEYLHVLHTMDPCGQAGLLDRYIEEATNYKAKTPLEVVQGSLQVVYERFHDIEDKVINLLEGTLTDAIPLDVAFCRLIILIPYVQPSIFSGVFVAFFFYFVVGSCFPSLRKHIRLPCKLSEIHDESRVLSYLMDTYFAHVNNSRCLKFKYYGNKSTDALASVLEEYIYPSIASIICGYVQYPNQEFIHFIDNFVSHFRLHRYQCRGVNQCIGFVDNCDGAILLDGDLLSRLLICERFIDHNDDRLKYEGHRIALMKLNTGDEINRYFNATINKSIRCHVNPQLFIELFEFAVCNPWHVMRDAIVNHSFSILFNG
eukprot:361887_1